jgi:hypothetical protein
MSSLVEGQRQVTFGLYINVLHAVLFLPSDGQVLFVIAVARRLSFTLARGQLLDHVCPPACPSQRPRIVSIVVYACAYLILIFGAAPQVRPVIDV